MNLNYAHNPILPADLFIPDVEAHVWEDGRIYLYGSFDIRNSENYCSDVYHVYSSDDMVHWTDHGQTFSLADTAWAKDCMALYAPDCAYRDGWYYLYYCVPDGRCGVAKSQSPAGPFEDVGPIEGVWGIDPAVLMDDDGQAYLYWGQLTWGKAAKLKDNMVEIDPDTVTDMLTIEEHEFHEGSSVKKINGKYYFLFADTHRHGNRPTSLGYAVSDSPLGKYEYKGVIIDNFGSDPSVWNNHGSMECFKGQWYVFYHRATHNGARSRRVCIEPIFFDEEGNIGEVIQTTSGVGGPISATTGFTASLACELSGRVFIAGDETSSEHLVLTNLANGDTAAYRYLDFDGETVFSIRMKSTADCRVELYVDGMYHADFKVAAAETYADTRAAIPALQGAHTLTLKFYGEFTDGAVESFTFTIDDCRAQ